MIKKVMCFGTFDILHLGHLNYFEQAKKYGGHLTVVIARDITKERLQKTIAFNEDERLQLIQSLAIVDQAILGDKHDYLKVIRKHSPDIICLGYDHPVDESLLGTYLPDTKIIRCTPYQTNKHKSTKIRETIFTLMD